eukprot:Rhum_TRINITY_DN13339_c0_g1::Rhum_TRINITY_DN13339_c0_g1_i1::g.58835::m.58835
MDPQPHCRQSSPLRRPSAPRPYRDITSPLATAFVPASLPPAAALALPRARHLSIMSPGVLPLDVNASAAAAAAAAVPVVLPAQPLQHPPPPPQAAARYADAAAATASALPLPRAYSPSPSPPSPSPVRAVAEESVPVAAAAMLAAATTPAPSSEAEQRAARALRAVRTLPASEYARMLGPTHPPPEALPMLRPLMLLLGLVRAPARDPTELYDKRSRAWAAAWRELRRLPWADVEARLLAVAPAVLLRNRLARSLLKEMHCDPEALRRLSQAAVHLHAWCAALLEGCPTRAADATPDCRDAVEAKAARIIHQTKVAAAAEAEAAAAAEAARTAEALETLNRMRRIVHNVDQWLEALQLEQYKAVFAEAEVRDLHTASLITEPDLVEMGIPIGPKRKLLKAVSRLQEQAAAAAAS